MYFTRSITLMVGFVILASCSAESSPSSTSRPVQAPADSPTTLRLSFEPIGSTGMHAVVPLDQQHGISRTASVVLPTRADDAVMLEDDTSHRSIRFSSQNASDSRVTIVDGLALYRGAVAGADVVHRVSAEGTEDFVLFNSKPTREQLDYDVDVNDIAGLRLVANVIEFLDENGAPRLRVAPPYVDDASHKRHEARLSIAGCAYDTNPAAPWGRPVTRAGASSCVISIAWSEVAYPAIVDPAWSATGSLHAEREYHAAALLGSGKVLVLGGYNGGVGFINTAEIYDPASGTFATTGTMSFARQEPSATVLPSGEVLVAGGYNGTYVASAELYDPNAGTFTTTGTMVNGRYRHVASLLAGGSVLFAGGYNGAYLSSAEVYSSGSFTSTGGMSIARSSASAALLGGGKVLVTGGRSTPTNYLATSEIYDPLAGTFSAGPSMETARYAHTSTLLPSGKVLVAGGYIVVSTVEQYLSSAEIFDNGTFSPTGDMNTPRMRHVAIALPTGPVLVAGGLGPGGTGTSTDAADLFDEAKGTFAASGTMTISRYLATATLLPSGKVLVTGGQSTNGNTLSILASSEIFRVTNSGACQTSNDCVSTNCVDGVCCDTACVGECEACDVQGSVGTCTGVDGVPHGARVGCEGNGICGGVCVAATRNTCTYPSSSTSCAAVCVDAKETTSACDGQGHCATAAPAQCPGNYGCDTTGAACLVTCKTDTDCAGGFVCNSGQCIAGGSCIDAHTAANGDDCGRYTCDTNGTCKNTCVSVADCTSPNVCDSTDHCVALPPSSGGCSATGESPEEWSLVGLLILAARRRRKASTVLPEVLR